MVPLEKILQDVEKDIEVPTNIKIQLLEKLLLELFEWEKN